MLGSMLPQVALYSGHDLTWTQLSYVGMCNCKMGSLMTQKMANFLWVINPFQCQFIIYNSIWARSRRCICLVTWFCYLMIAKPGNTTGAPPWPDPYRTIFGELHIDSLMPSFKKMLSSKSKFSSVMSLPCCYKDSQNDKLTQWSLVMPNDAIEMCQHCFG